ncbi:MAG: hypothetical protein ACFBZ8_03190 [Opitutales bacterium]
MLTLVTIHSYPMHASNNLHESPAEWALPSKARCYFDGVYYSYAHPEGQGIKIWVPPGDARIRGVILAGNPGYGLGGDLRNLTRARHLLEFAARHDFAVGGVTGFDARRTYETLGQRVLEAFTAWGQYGTHPELEHTPFVFTGSSNAGMFAFAMMLLVPERTICITSNVGPYYKGLIDDRARGVPALMHIGTSDPFLADGVKDTETLFLEHAPRNALWAWDAEMKGHEIGDTKHVDMAYWQEVIQQRVPDNYPGSREEPVELKTLDPAQGWLANNRTWDYAMTDIFPANELEAPGASREHCSWLPSEGMARLYQSIASRTRQLTIAFVEDNVSGGGAETGVLLSSGGNQLMVQGEVVTLSVELAPLLWGVETVEFFDRDRKLGEIELKETKTFSFTLEDQAVYALHARAKQEVFGRDAQVLSNPLLMVVRKPGFADVYAAQLRKVDWLKNHPRRVLNPVELPRIRGEASFDKAATLLAAPVDEPMGAALRTHDLDGETWQTLRKKARPTIIDRTHELGADPTQANVRVFAGYARQGLFLLFDIENDPKAEALDGRLDFHLASVGLPELMASEGSPEFYANAARDHLLRHALQMAFDVEKPSGPVDLNYWDPFDWNPLKLNANDKFGGTGLIVLRQAKTRSTCSVALCVPWSMVGNPGFSEMPPAGSSLVTVLGYTPADQTVRLRWPHARDPWNAKPFHGPEEAPPVFGHILLTAP